MPRPTAEMWAIARAKWEADPLLTYDELGKTLGISKQAVQKRAATGNWQRHSDGLAVLAARAHARADQNIDVQIENVDPAIKKKGVDDREAVRATILTRHRTEVNGPRKLIYDAMQSKDPDVAFKKARLAKLAMDTLQVAQSMERKAWGLDAGENPAGATIVIERT